MYVHIHLVPIYIYMEPLRLNIYMCIYIYMYVYIYIYVCIYIYICIYVWRPPTPPPPKYLPFSVFPDQVRSSAHRFCISSSRVLACTCAYLSRSPSQSQMGEIVLSHSPKVVLSHAVLEPGAQCRTLKTSGPLRTFARQDAQNHETCQCFGLLYVQNIGTSQHFRRPGRSKL